MVVSTAAAAGAPIKWNLRCVATKRTTTTTTGRRGGTGTVNRAIARVPGEGTGDASSSSSSSSREGGQEDADGGLERDATTPRARGREGARRRRAREIQDAIGACEGAYEVLDVVDGCGEEFNAVNSVTAMYKISRLLTSRTGRLRRSEAKAVAADPRFARLLEMVEGGVQQLDKVGLEHRRWAYHKLALPSEYRMRAALSIRLLDRAKDFMEKNL